MNVIDLILDLREVETHLLLNITYPSSVGTTSMPDKLLTLDSLATVREMINAFMDAALRQVRTELNLI
jgi:hypothetical protein